MATTVFAVRKQSKPKDVVLLTKFLFRTSGFDTLLVKRYVKHTFLATPAPPVASPEKYVELILNDLLVNS